MRTRKQVDVALGLQVAHDGTTDQATVAGDVDFGSLFHLSAPRLQW